MLAYGQQNDHALRDALAKLKLKPGATRLDAARLGLVRALQALTEPVEIPGLRADELVTVCCARAHNFLITHTIPDTDDKYTHPQLGQMTVGQISLHTRGDYGMNDAAIVRAMGKLKEIIRLATLDPDYLQADGQRFDSDIEALTRMLYSPTSWANAQKRESPSLSNAQGRHAPETVLGGLQRISSILEMIGNADRQQGSDTGEEHAASYVNERAFLQQGKRQLDQLIELLPEHLNLYAELRGDLRPTPRVREACSEGNLNLTDALQKFCAAHIRITNALAFFSDTNSPYFLSKISALESMHSDLLTGIGAIAHLDAPMPYAALEGELTSLFHQDRNPGLRQFLTDAIHELAAARERAQHHVALTADSRDPYDRAIAACKQMLEATQNLRLASGLDQKTQITSGTGR